MCPDPPSLHAQPFVTHRPTSSLSHGWLYAVAVRVGDARVPPELTAGHWASVASCQPCWAESPCRRRAQLLGFLGTLVAIQVPGGGQGSPGTSSYQEPVAPQGRQGRAPDTQGWGAAERAARQTTGSPAGTRPPRGGQGQTVQPGGTGGKLVAHSPCLLCSATHLYLRGRRCETPACVQDAQGQMWTRTCARTASRPIRQ